VPELFMTEVLAVLARLPDAIEGRVVEALALLEALGLARVGNGHDLLAQAARIAVSWQLSGYDATYVALARLVDGVWLTADVRAARRVRERRRVQVLGRTARA
jgi:predicted nucleic acid-binding protein